MRVLLLLLLVVAASLAAPSKAATPPSDSFSRAVAWVKNAGHAVYDFFAGEHGVFAWISRAWKKVNSLAAVKETTLHLKKNLREISPQHIWHKLKKEHKWRIFLAIWANCTVFVLLYTILLERSVRMTTRLRDPKKGKKGEKRERKPKNAKRLRNPFSRKAPRDGASLSPAYSPDEPSPSPQVAIHHATTPSRTDPPPARRQVSTNLRDVDLFAKSPEERSLRE